jgi:hypothetical protein
MKLLAIALMALSLGSCQGTMPNTAQMYEEAAANGVITPEEAEAIGRQAQAEGGEGHPWWAWGLSGLLTVGAALGLGRALPNGLLLGASAAKSLERKRK